MFGNGGTYSRVVAREAAGLVVAVATATVVACEPEMVLRTFVGVVAHWPFVLYDIWVPNRR